MTHPAFELLEEMRLPGGVARHLRHLGSGADVVVLEDGRRESAFSISFATDPPDDGGAAHVLEHLIFRGSRSHPDDQLYTALRNGSLLSHLNASTRPASTSYQLASPVEADLLRGEAILLEAVLHPLLTLEAFEQEGISWRGGTASGVVFHEMTGHMARPDARLEAALRRALLAGSPEARAYGGDPAGLARLRLEDVAAFHRAFYRPENALVLLTGAAALAPRLAGLDAAFSAVAGRGKPPQTRSAKSGAAAVTVQLAQGGPSALGWRLPDLPPETVLLLAQTLQEAAGAGLWSQSGAVIDGRHPYLQLLAPHPLWLDPCGLAGGLTEAAVARITARCLLREQDAAADFRLPAGLQARAALLGAWLQGGPLLRPLGVAQQLRAALTAPARQCGLLIEALRALPPPQVAEVPALSAPQPPEDGAPPRKMPPLEAGPRWTLPPLPRELLPRRVEQTVIRESEGILLLPDPSDGLLRIAIGVALRDVDAAEAEGFAAEIGGVALPGAAEMEVSTPSGPVPMLMLGLKLLEADLPAVVAELGQALSRPFTIRSSQTGPLHLRLAERLRGRLWQDELAGRNRAGTLHAAVGLVIATNKASAVPGLARLRGDLGLTTCLPRVPKMPSAICGSAPQFIEAPGLAPGLAGRAADLSALNPALGWLALRAIEHGRLWPQLRVAGGAYGLRVGLDENGLASIVTAQDPQPMQSLAIMAEAGAWLAEHATDALLEQARIAAVGEIFAPKTPDLRLAQAVAARFKAGEQACEISMETGWRQADLDAALTCDRDGLRQLGLQMAEAFARGPSAVMGDGTVLASLK